MKTFRILAILGTVAATALASCSVLEDDLQLNNGAENLDGIVLRFDCGDSFDVKATTNKPGVGALNENTLNSVEVFMYSDVGTGNDAIVHAYFTNVQTTGTYNVSVTDVIVAALCPNQAEKFRIYAIANYPRIVPEPQGNNPEDLSHTSVPELEVKLHSLEMTGNNVDTPQSGFLMATDGAPLTDANVNPRNTSIVTTTVRLKRVAAKVEILVRVAEEYAFNNTLIINNDTTVRYERWKPIMSGMKVYLVNGAKNGQVSGQPLSNPTPFQYQELLFKTGENDGETHTYAEYSPRVDNEGHYVYDENDDLIFDCTEKSDKFYPSTYPFYSYPKRWSYGSDEEPYLKLVIPWVRQRDDNQGISQLQKQYYYRVYCPASANSAGTSDYDAEFLRNHWYKILLNVGILGSETDGGEVTLTGSYYIVDWQERDKGNSQQGQTSTGVNDSDKEAEIKGARYLFVNKDTYELFNIEDLSIPYITSDDCEIADVTAKKYIYSGAQKDSTSTSVPAEWDIDIHLETTATGGHIEFYHPLNNDTNGTDYDVSPYYITFTLRQRSNHEYAKTITVMQYPAIMIDLQANSDANKSKYGYAYVNGCTGTNNNTYYTYQQQNYSTTRQFYLGTAPGSANSSNKNYNMVVIETTVLPADSEYMLGDPRKSTIDNLQSTSWPTSANSNTASNWSRSAAQIQGNSNRYLSYYYPTDPENYANNIIAPKFRIASSWGATQPMRYADAFRRCASYQEDGYPAGRWRVPTVAEIMYIAKLNADGKIQRLLGSDTSGSTTDYWCNSGYMTVKDGSTDPPVKGTGTWSNTTYKYVRCVYDDWYWEDAVYNNTSVAKVARDSYKWGDMER